MRDIRRLDILWSGEEAAEHDMLKEEAARAREETPEYVKSILRNHLGKRKS